MSKACARLSNAHGPAISASGKPLPNRALPTLTMGLGFVVMRTFAADHEARGRPGQPRPARLGNVYFTAEKAVGCRIWLLAFARIGPSFSLSARAEIQAGSLMKAFHFFSRSASDSQARRYVSSWLESPIKVVQNPACLMPCLSHNLSVVFSNRLSSAGSRPGTVR